MESLDLGNDVSLIVVDMRPRPADSSAAIQMRLGIVGVVVEGLIERQTNCFDVGEGRAAAERLAWGRR